MLGGGLGLTAYFIGAIATVLRARVYADLKYPAFLLALAAASLVLRLAVGT